MQIPVNFSSFAFFGYTIAIFWIIVFMSQSPVNSIFSDSSLQVPTTIPAPLEAVASPVPLQEPLSSLQTPLSTQQVERVQTATAPLFSIAAAQLPSTTHPLSAVQIPATIIPSQIDCVQQPASLTEEITEVQLPTLTASLEAVSSPALLPPPIDAVQSATSIPLTTRNYDWLLALLVWINTLGQRLYQAPTAPSQAMAQTAWKELKLSLRLEERPPLENQSAHICAFVSLLHSMQQSAEAVPPPTALFDSDLLFPYVYKQYPSLPESGPLFPLIIQS